MAGSPGITGTTSVSTTEPTSGAVALALYKGVFLSRLANLAHIIEVANDHFEIEADAILGDRLVADMLPLGAQVAYACNQARNFSLWCRGLDTENLSPDVVSLAQMSDILQDTLQRLEATQPRDEMLGQIKRIDLADDYYIELTGAAYVNDFLLPNFYFHLTTAYNIVRMRGGPLGKRDYMHHLVPLLQRQET